MSYNIAFFQRKRELRNLPGMKCAFHDVRGWGTVGALEESHSLAAHLEISERSRPRFPFLHNKHSRVLQTGTPLRSTLLGTVQSTLGVALHEAGQL